MAKPWPGYLMMIDGPDNVTADVIEVQKRLSVQQTGVYGPTTAQNVCLFQKNNKIGQTSMVGEQTWNALFNPPPVPHLLGPHAKSWALNEGYVPVREDPVGSNRGARVEQYQKAAGQPPGTAWCMSFVYWCIKQVSIGEGYPMPFPMTASCSYLYGWARDNGKLVTDPEPGDIFLCRGGDTGHYHTGFVTDNDSGGYFSSVEGNSNSDGSSNGIEVAIRNRKRAVSDCDFVRV